LLRRRKERRHTSDLTSARDDSGHGSSTGNQQTNPLTQGSCRSRKRTSNYRVQKGKDLPAGGGEGTTWSLAKKKKILSPRSGSAVSSCLKRGNSSVLRRDLCYFEPEKTMHRQTERGVQVIHHSRKKKRDGDLWLRGEKKGGSVAGKGLLAVL